MGKQVRSKVREFIWQKNKGKKCFLGHVRSCSEIWKNMFVYHTIFHNTNIWNAVEVHYYWPRYWQWIRTYSGWLGITFFYECEFRHEPTLVTFFLQFFHIHFCSSSGCLNNFLNTWEFKTLKRTKALVWNCQQKIW